MPYQFDQTVFNDQIWQIQQNLIGKYNYYEMKGINMQYSQYVQRSNLDQLETELELTEPKRATSGSKSSTGRLFVLELSSGQVFSCVGQGDSSVCSLNWQSDV